MLCWSLGKVSLVVSANVACMNLSIDRATVAARDASDPLRHKRDAFVLPEGVIYLDGNSLGPLPKASRQALQAAVEQEWGAGLIRSWNAAQWIDLPLILGDRVGRLIGAAEGQTVVTDTTSINIHKALQASLDLRRGRSTIVAEGAGFPTDLYMIEGLASVRSDLRIRREGVDAPDIVDLLDDDVAAVLVSQADFRTGALRDMAGLTARIHAAGALAVWDLCHSAGALEVEFDAVKADFAVGCTYKYLNGGPGAPAFVSVASRHHNKFSQPLTGWWGHARQFAFEPDFAPGEGIRMMMCGTPPILSMRALAGALDVFDDVDLATLRQKSLGLSDLFIACVEQSCGPFGVVLATPREHMRRGSQVSFRQIGRASCRERV